MVNIRSESPKWTFIFIGICTLVFIIQQFTVSWIYFAFFPRYALSMPWTFITSIFLHADISHLMLNMIALFFFGLTLESIIGRKRFALLFIISGVVGNVGYYLTAIDPAVPAIGSSGAVYGIIGALTAITPFRIVWIYGILPIPLIAAVALWVLIDLTGLFLPTGIAHGAHLGGILVGILYGLYFRAKLKRDITGKTHSTLTLIFFTASFLGNLISSKPFLYVALALVGSTLTGKLKLR